MSASAAGPEAPRRIIDAALVAEVLAVLLALTGLLVSVLHSGGRDRGNTAVTLALTAPALLACRPWQRLRRRELAISAAVAVAAVVVPLVTPLGLSGARDLDVWLYAPAAYVAIRAFALDAQRRRIVALGLLGIGAIEFTRLIPVWRGTHDPDARMVGTFYWHNQFGVFAAAMAVFALALAVRSRHAEDILAWLVAPAMLAGLGLSHSRASELAAAFTLLLLVAVLVARRAGWQLLRLAIGLGLGAGTAWLFIAAVRSGHHELAGSAATVRGLETESVSSASSTRTTFWRAAWHIFVHAPLVSHGYNSFAVLAPRAQPAGSGISTWAHSGPLQVLSDGGVVLGVPVLTAALAGVTRATRPLHQGLSRLRDLDTVRVAAALALLTLLAHTCVDFDWQYPALAAVAAVMLALLGPDAGATAAPRAAPERATRPRRTVAIAVAALAAIAGAAVFGLVQEHQLWQVGDRLARADAVVATDPSAAVRLAATAMTDDPLAQLRAGVWLVDHADTGSPVPPATLERALEASRPLIDLDPTFATTWRAVHAAHH